MKVKKLLEAVGLSAHESLLYVTLLEGGNQTISELSRRSGVHRPVIYSTLPQLEEKGLVNKRQVGKLIHYNAESPERLRALLETTKSELEQVIPELSTRQNTRTPVVRRLDGQAGITALYEDIVSTLQKGDSFYRYNAANQDDLFSVTLPESYTKMREKKQLERLVIAGPDYAAGRGSRLEESLRVVPEQFYPFEYNMSQIVYGDKIAFIDYTQPIVTIIENPILAQMQRDIFLMLFRKLDRA